MLHKDLPKHSKFRFCFLELSGIFSNVFDPQLVESADAELGDEEKREGVRRVPANTAPFSIRDVESPQILVPPLPPQGDVPVSQSPLDTEGQPYVCRLKAVRGQ